MSGKEKTVVVVVLERDETIDSSVCSKAGNQSDIIIVRAQWMVVEKVGESKELI